MHNHDHNYAHYHCSLLSYCSIIGSLSWKDSRDESWPLFCPATAPRFSPFLWGTAGRGCKVVSRGGKHRKLPLCGAGRPSLTSTTNDWRSKPEKKHRPVYCVFFPAVPASLSPSLLLWGLGDNSGIWKQDFMFSCHPWVTFTDDAQNIRRKDTIWFANSNSICQMCCQQATII